MNKYPIEDYEYEDAKTDFWLAVVLGICIGLLMADALRLI